MPGISATIKAALKTKLDALVSAGTLGEVQEDDLRKSIFERDFGAYPAAVLTSPATDSEALDNRDNMRSYFYEVVVFQKADNITSATAIEELIETLLDKFDNDPGLAGTAVGGVFPSTSRPEPALIHGNQLIVFSILIKARGVKQLTF